MSEKHLTELPWKALTLKHKIKDPKLGKALAAFADCDAANPEAQLKAIALVEKEAELLRKEQKANKDVDKYLGEILNQVDLTRKAAELLKKAPKEKPPTKDKAPEEKKPVAKEKAPEVKKPVAKEKAPEVKKEEEEAEEAGDEEEPGVDIKSALTGAMGKVKARKAGDPPMGAMLCQMGKEFGVLLAGNVGAAQQKKLREVMKGTGHAFAKGTCEWGKGDIYTFLLKAPLSGAAAGLKKFFQEHTGASYKLRVGVPGAMEEELAEAEGTEEEAGKTKTSPTLTAYVKARKDWKAAKAAAEKNIGVLKAAILAQCDPELEALVKPKINAWDGILTTLDDNVILPMIDVAIKETDEENQTKHNENLAKSVTQMLTALQQHPLAAVADDNPFGKYYIRGPLNLMLTRLGTAFSG